MQYLYETHLHTCQASACASATGKEHVRFYKALGFQGIIVTDHFFGGNTAIPRTGTWKERVGLFCRGYEEALEEGLRIGLDVFFGWEQNYQGDEYLIYGPDPQWLLEHPEIEHCSRRRQLELVHEAGGCVVQAHPFRSRAYLSRVLLAPDYCDGVEVANAGNYAFNDALAYRYAMERGMTMTAGSDNHHSDSGMGTHNIMGVVLDHRLNGVKDYAALILRHGSIGLNVPTERFRMTDDELGLETFYLDDSERPVPTNRDWKREG